jgi:tryptophan-rich sensory protein
VLLYQHVDDIGFEIIMLGMFLLMLASFGYVGYRRQPFTWEQTKPISFVPDYVLLLGCLLFLALDTYFAEGLYGLATLLPAVLFFGLAYRFDHRGVLAMAITAVASWVGVSIAPLSTYSTYSFHHSSLSSVGIGLGLLLAGVGLLSDFLRRKRHFTFTYISLGANLALVAAASMLFDSSSLFAASEHLFPNWLVVLLILALSVGLVWYARRTRSYLFLLMGSLYAYFAVTYLFINLLDHSYGLGDIALMLYLMTSAVVVVVLFLNSKKFLRLS